MSVTRLLVLGAVQIFQPAHGYLVRRELVSWEAERWAHLNPGSIYHALKILTRQGLLAEEPAAQAASPGPAAKAASRVRSRATASNEAGTVNTTCCSAIGASGCEDSHAATRCSK